MFRVRSAVAYAIHKYFNERGFVYVHAAHHGQRPEGAGEMFQVTTLDMDNPPRTPEGAIDYSKDLFGKEANLTVSGQLEAECYALAFKRSIPLGQPSGQKTATRRAMLRNFWMIEPEIAFADINDDMDLAEDMVKYIIQYVLETLPEEMEFFNSFIDKGLLARLDNIVNSDFARITYTEAVDILKKSGQKFEYPVEWGIDLQSEHERYITEKVFGKPVFVTAYPKGDQGVLYAHE